MLQPTAAAASAAPNGLGDLQISFSNLELSHIELCLIGYGVCFLVLLSLAVIFTLFQKALKSRVNRVQQGAAQVEEDLSGEVNAAIALALHLHFSALHDRENTVLTIERRQSTYSPCSLIVL